MASYALDALNREWSVVEFGGKVRCVKQEAEKIKPYTKADFHDLLANKLVFGMAKHPVSIATVWWRHSQRRQYVGVTFCPACDESEYSGCLNLFTRYGVEAKAGDWSLLRAHILDIICDGNAEYFTWLMAWMAQLVQQPIIKMGTAVVLKGEKGTGKTKLAECLMKIIGVHATRATQGRHVTGNFNQHLASCLLLVCEEAVWAGDKQAEGVLKSLITDNSIMLEGKGINAFEIDNFTRVFITTNEAWAVPATYDERRFFVLDVSSKRKQDTAYFAAIDEQMNNGGAEAFLHDLLNDGDGWRAIDLRNPPKTKALLDQVVEGLPVVALWWMAALVEGGIYDDSGMFLPFNDGVHTLVAKSHVYADARKAVRGTWVEKSLPTKVGAYLYENIPGLEDSKVTRHGDRIPTYVFPALEEMRAAFETKYGMAPWKRERTSEIGGEGAEIEV